MSDLIQPVTPTPVEAEAEREEMLTAMMDRLADIDAVRGVGGTPAYPRTSESLTEPPTAQTGRF